MKHTIFSQKNIFSNNINSTLNGIYGIIGENSNFNIQNISLDVKIYSDIVLNNTKFISNLSKKITVNSFNNSQVTFNNGTYIINSDNYAPRNQFPVPFFKQQINGLIQKQSTILYPSNTVSISRNIVTNYTSTFFAEFKDSILEHNLTFNIDEWNIVTACSADNNNILAYNLFDINQDNQHYQYYIWNVIENLPKSMNGHIYTFNFWCTNFNNGDGSTPVLNFNDFHGGKLNLNFLNINKDYKNTLNFINCDNIQINGNNNSFYSSNCTQHQILQPIFLFDNCHTINILSCNLVKYYKLSSTIDFESYDKYIGNSMSYETGGCITLKNSNLYLNNCIISANNDHVVDKSRIGEDKYLGLPSSCNNTVCKWCQKYTMTNRDKNNEYYRYSIIAFNSKLLFDSVTFDKNLKLVLDEFSTAAYDSNIQNLDIIENQITSTNVYTDNYINNGLLNHYHTDHLRENNTVPIGSVVGFGMWYRKTQFDNALASLKNSYENISQNALSGLAAISAANYFNQIPKTFLPLCGPPVAALAITSYFPNQFNELSASYVSSLYTSAIFFNSLSITQKIKNKEIILSDKINGSYFFAQKKNSTATSNDSNNIYYFATVLMINTNCNSKNNLKR